MTAITLSALGICCALGNNKQQVWQAAVNGSRHGMVWRNDLLSDATPVVVGEVSGNLPSLAAFPAEFHSRNNQLALQALQQMMPQIEQARQRYGQERIAVIIGTSTSGIAEGETALAQYRNSGDFPPSYHYHQQEMQAPARFIARASDVTGPCYAISTACSSSARALMSARSLLLAGIADAVIVGGVDSLCRLTVNGFHALESVAAGFCQPFGLNRDGINIGEGAALFLMEKNTAGIRLMGAAASSDASHMSAPHPEGRGAEQAIISACQQAGISPQQLSYINLHGTATPLNDLMESKVLARIGAAQIPASSTKALTGHTLGAAGAIEAALCWLMLSDYNGNSNIIPHCCDNPPDPALAPVQLATAGMQAPLRYCLSNSFAFGGNNVAVLLGKEI
ncbi:beta-ketoacyl-[acyl-carrier-protein] synthase family protein [Chromatiaceae bacterium AAb-1]|nr:beta-ketoacyl-[acyl-carrier-protein] synthase family protein [Chromatiaceae bacterium AAb-1]